MQQYILHYKIKKHKKVTRKNSLRNYLQLNLANKVFNRTSRSKDAMFKKVQPDSYWCLLLVEDFSERVRNDLRGFDCYKCPITFLKMCMFYVFFLGFRGLDQTLWTTSGSVVRSSTMYLASDNCEYTVGKLSC